jgi:predicted transcriptional regulator
MEVSKVFTHHVVGIPRTASLAEAARLMKNQEVGALIVTDDFPQGPRAAGIVTDRDLVLHAMADSLAPTSFCVGDVMTEVPGTVPAHADIHDAIELMRMGGYRRLAVTDVQGDVLGILSFDDIVQALAADFVSLAALLQSEREREHERHLQFSTHA